MKRNYMIFILGISFLFIMFNTLPHFLVSIQNNMKSSLIKTNQIITANYTYITYICADNNLENYGKGDINEMELGFNDSVTDVHVITLLDILNGGTTAYYISYDDNPSTINSTILEVEGLNSEENMGDPNTLITFVNWCMTYYPAEHYILDLWDHGSGWAICFDENSGDDALTMTELRSALDTINSSTGNMIDILCMDACLMGTLEVAYEIRNYASILIASEDAVIADGFPYNGIIADLCNDPNQNITEFASTIVDLFDESVSYYSYTLSAVNLTIVDSLLFPNFAVFAQNLHSYLNEGIKNELYNARGASQEFYYPEFIDLYDFAEETRNEASNITIRQLAQNLLDNITPAIINEKHNSNPGAHGLSIYFPEYQSSYESAYSTSFSLSNDSMWDDFLIKYYISANFGLGLRYYTINDSLENNNQTPDPGETLLINITLENVGELEAGFVNGTLICLDTENVTIIEGFKNYGNISVNKNGSQSFIFNISNTCSNYHLLPFIIVTESVFDIYEITRNFTFELVVGRKITLGGITLQTATEITEGYIYGILPGPGYNREAWLKINCSKNFYLFLNLTGPALTDFDAYIYDPAENLISVAGKANYPDECCHFLMKDGFYYIKLDPFSGFGYYSLFINLTTEPYEDGSFFGLAFTLLGNSTINGTMPGPGTNGYLYYRVIVYTGQELIIYLEGPVGTDFDLHIYNPNFDHIASSIWPMSSEHCILTAKSTGYYYILVVPSSGSGEFTLMVEVKDKPFPPWLLTLLIFLTVFSIVVTVAYYVILVRRSRDYSSTDYDIYDINF